MAPVPTPSLLGPPSIHRPKPSQTTPAANSDPFMDLMLKKFNSTKLLQTPPKGYTENGSPTFLSTGNPCLDFFFHVVPDTPAETLTQRLRLAWEHDAVKTLKLICNLRGVRGTGKSDKEGYYTAALWLHQHHPKTLACNVGPLADFGYFKDLPEILFRILEGPDVRQIGEQEKLSRTMVQKRDGGHNLFCRSQIGVPMRRQNKKIEIEKAPTESQIIAEKKRVEMVKEIDQENKKEKRIAMAKKAVERHGSDPDYRFLYERVSDLFSELLKLDLKYLKEGQLRKISLAAKWCPSIDSSFDQSTLLCESIAKKVFDRESYREYEGVEEAHYIYRVRDRLRKGVLVPLRKVLELPEVYIGANDWGSIPYNRVASVAMKLYRGKFFKHDGTRFKEYLENVKSGKTTIAAGALLPHEIIASLYDVYRQYGYGYGYGYSDDDNEDDGEDDDDDEDDDDEDDDDDDDDDDEEEKREQERKKRKEEWEKKKKEAEVELQVPELQWKRMVDDLARKGKLKNCMAICDVSGSMTGIPMDVSVALGILVSDLSEEPWKGKLITFSHNPTLQFVTGEDLRSKVEFVKKMEWGMNTNFQKVFNLILEVAVNGNLREEDMIKRVFVFSDMEFDEASTNKWETDYEAIVRKFTEKGYGSSVPEIVFWNLRDSEATPVPSNQPGVALVSGYSKNLMTLFLEDNGKINPESLMDAAIAGDEYKKLVVLD